MYKYGDVESGPGALYPAMIEDPQLRWGFIRKVYAIITIQLLMTVVVATIVVTVHPIHNFFAFTKAGFWLYIAIVLSMVIVMIPLTFCHQRHPWNLIFLSLFTVAMSFVVGLACAFTKGKVVLEAVILTTVIVVCLTLYTFWAAKRGQDFNFLGPFLFAGIMMLLVFSLIQIFFPLGKTSVMIYGVLAAIIFCGYIVYDTDNLIKRFSYDDYIIAAVSLYLDIINLFMALLQILNATDN